MPSISKVVLSYLLNTPARFCRSIVLEARVIQGAVYLQGVVVDTSGIQRPKNGLLMRRGLTRHRYKHAINCGDIRRNSTLLIVVDTKVSRDVRFSIGDVYYLNTISKWMAE